jgi:acyl carrier protein
MNNYLIEIIKEVISQTIPEIELSNENLEDNLQQLGMNSFEFIRIVVLLEEKFGVEIPDEYLLISQMNTIKQIYYVLIKILNVRLGESYNESITNKTWSNGLEQKKTNTRME